MRNRRDIFLPSITTLVFFVITWFLSCSHQALNKRKVANSNPLAEGVEVGWDGSESSEKLSEMADLSFEKSVKNQLEIEKASQKEKNFEVPLTEEEVAATSPSLTSKAPEVTPLPASKNDERNTWKSELPEIPTQPLITGEIKLNRFYFLRRGDTPEKLSQLIFSSSKEAPQLKNWNSGSWKPGKLIFYNSPVQPQDSKMLSFYAESKVKLEEYQVGNGESLSKISQKLLGDYQSWKELAVVNGLQEPDLLKAGTVLGYYPQELTKKLSKPIEEKPKPINSAQAPQTKNPASLVDQAPSSPAQAVNPPAPAVTPPSALEPAKPVQAQMPQKQQPNPPARPQTQGSWTKRVLGFFQNLWSDTTYWLSEFQSDFSRQPSSKKRKK